MAVAMCVFMLLSTALAPVCAAFLSNGRHHSLFSQHLDKHFSISAILRCSDEAQAEGGDRRRASPRQRHAVTRWRMLAIRSASEARLTSYTTSKLPADQIQYLRSRYTHKHTYYSFATSRSIV